MKILTISIIAFLFLHSCVSSYKKIDLNEARRLVYLDSNDLAYFSQLRQKLISDSAAVRKLYETVAAPPNRNSWMTTNSYYLKQIDSAAYTELFSRLKGKLVDFIRLNTNGSVIFRIKENVQMNAGYYSEAYSHELVSADCNCPVNTVYSNVDTVYVDSVINKDWRYVFCKVLTGH